MPTRLLHLSSEAIRLCITDAPRLRVPYMTLSHCWGSAQFLKLTLETFEQLSTGVPLRDLPQTFQDAVLVAQRLGAQYLWIDSLCIFQDSESDWQAQSATMSDVYRGALCNIAATASDNSRGGLFRSRNPNYISCYVITTQYINFANETYHLMEYNTSKHYIDQYLYGNEPLLGRGWVVQERLLAPRVLHFGESQAFWECREDIYCEAYPRGVPIHSQRQKMYSPPMKFEDPGPQAQQKIEKTKLQDFHTTVYSFWERIVKIYTRCNLTKEDDKLVAIAGIAEEIDGYLFEDDKYLGGVWHNDLFAQLSWYTDQPRKFRPSTYRAPSWSWASVDGPISYFSDRYLTYWRDFSNSVVSSEVENSSPDEFGQVRSGSIRITGPLKTFTCTYNPHQTYQDPEFRCELKTSHPYQHGPTNEAPKVYWDIANELEESSLVHENGAVHRLHWMPFFPKDAHTKTAAVYGLILQPTGALQGQFKRLGMMCVMGPQIQWSMDVSRLATPEPQHSWFEYEEFDGSNYTISVV